MNETTLVFAFRYALTRRTGATHHMVAELKAHWTALTDQTKEQIQREILDAMSRGECEVETWDRVLGWAKDACPVCDMVGHNCLCLHET